MKIKKLIPVLLAFAAGFAVHMYYFQDLLPQTFTPSRPKGQTNAAGIAIPTPEFAKSATYVEYANGFFSPKSVVTRVSDHLYIRNMDAKEGMWLTSDVDFLRTSRPYGKSEQIDIVPHRSGTFVIKNKLNDAATLTVIIK